MATMNPSPTKPVVRYPTALLEDKELVTIHDSRLPDYKALEYGTPYPDQNKFPGLKLIFQEPLEDDRMVRRVWAGDRKDQDLYNADRKYSGGSTEHPILIRRYLFPEDGYEPLPTGTPDSQFPEAVLVEEEVAQPENRNGYLAVTRVFETLPGPLLTGVQITEKGQIATITTQVVEPGTTVTPSALVIGGSVKPDSKGKSVLEKIEVPEVFSEKSFSIENPDPVPPKFRISVPSTTEEETVEGTAAAPTLGTGELAKSEQQVTKFTKRKRKTARPKSALPKTLTQVDTNEQQQKLFVSQTLSLGDTSRTPSVTVDVESEAMGDGTYVVQTSDEVEIFTSPSYSAELFDNTPEKFRSQVPVRTEERTEVGIARHPELKTGELSKSYQQVDNFKVRKKIVKRPTQLLPVNITQVETNQVGQKIVVTERLQAGDTTEEPNATTSIQSEAIGKGTYVVRKTQTPEVFSELTREIDRGNEVLPERFRAALPQEVVTEVVEGQVDPVLTLGPNEISKSEAQITKFTKRKRKSSRTITAIPRLRGQVYDEVLNKSTPYTEQILSGKNVVFPKNAEVTPLSDELYLARTYDTTTSREQLENYYFKFPSRENITLPNRLVSAKAVFTRSKGDGQGNGWGKNYEYKVESSTSVSGELLLEIEQGYSGSVPAEVHIFFVPADDGRSISNLIASKTNALPWPQIILKTSNVLLIGQTLTRSFSRSEGDPFDAENNYNPNGSLASSTATRSNTNLATVPPVLCGEIPIETVYYDGMPVGDWLDYMFDLSAQNPGVVFVDNVAISQIPRKDILSIPLDLPSLDGKVEPASIPATNPPRFPEGRFIYSSDVTLYKYGLLKVTAVVVETFGITGADTPDLPMPPIITSPDTASAVVGQSFVYQITASNSPTDFSCSGLKEPFRFDRRTGRITGVPKSSDVSDYYIRVGASNSAGASTKKVSFSISHS